MSSDVFARIATKYTSLGDKVGAVESYLSRQYLEVPIRIESAADFVRVRPEILRPIFDDLAEASVLDRRECWICTHCDTVIEGPEEDDGKRVCDTCDRRFSSLTADHETCYYLRRPIVSSHERRASAHGRDQVTNPMTDPTRRQQMRIAPWKTLREEQYTISVTTLHDGPKKQALKCLEEFGIVRLRWQADPPTAERLASIENWIGPARTRQNDYNGKVKSIKPNYDAPPNTGDSARELPPHVDGTQDPRTPAILGFQYDLTSTWGAESTFLDMAAVLSELSEGDLEEVLTTLARKDCATCTKTKGTWTQTFNGPLVRSECGDQSISIRLREDDLLTVITPCQSAFDKLKTVVTEWNRANKIRYTPHEGDVVIFDNWRILHGRAAIGGRHQRIHFRIWIDDLLPELRGQYLLGIRPIPSSLMAAVQSANS